MDSELIDRLTTQYVWAIQNESVWHHKARAALDCGDFGKFRRLTGPFINRIRHAQKEELGGMSWAFVVFELWTQMGGEPKLCLTDPGTLMSEFKTLVRGEDSAAEPYTAEASEIKRGRRKGDLFCTYGDAYTYKPADYSRQGRTYSFAELEVIRKMYHAGKSMSQIANTTKRTGLGICEKMRYMDLIERPNADGNYICKEDVPDNDHQNINPCSEILLEVSAHCELATSHFDRIAETLETMNKEKHMTIATNPNTAIETRTVIFGQDAAAMSDQQLIESIKKVEGQIATLKEVKTSSKKIASNIKELEKQLDAIVAVLDAR